MTSVGLDRILETVLYADDLEAAERFYRDVLGLEVDSRKDGIFVFFRLKGAMLLLFRAEAARANEMVPAHGAIGPGHACFAVAESELDGWKERLVRQGVRIEHGLHGVGELGLAARDGRVEQVAAAGHHDVEGAVLDAARIHAARAEQDDGARLELVDAVGRARARDRHADADRLGHDVQPAHDAVERVAEVGSEADEFGSVGRQDEDIDRHLRQRLGHAHWRGVYCK